MWKVLLVEDEPYIRRSVRKQIDWNELGYEIIGEADDGEQALEIMRAEKPDLVIADIMMPIMDGLELLKQSRQLGFDTCFIMLTCVNEFEYAKEAVEYGASGYVLKLSMSIESLRKKLIELSAELRKRRMQQLERFFGRWNGLYSSWWEEYAAKGSLGEAARPIEPVEYHEYAECLVIVLLLGPQASVSDRLQALRAANRSAEMEIHTFIRSGIATFFCWRRSAGKQDDEFSALEMQSQAVVLKVGFPRPERVRDTWVRALDHLRHKWYQVKSGYAAQADPIANRAIPWELEGKLIQYIEMGKLDDAFLILDRIWSLFEQQGIRIPIVKEESVRLEGMLLRIMRRPQTDQEILWLASSHQVLLGVLKQRLEAAQAQHLHETREFTDHEEINKIIHRIHQYYDKEITLKSMAEYVNMDEHYVSSLFKRKTGDTLINFLQKHRIERAKRYLTETDFPIHEIGHLVGFANNNYFSKIFRRWVQLTPSEYRKALS
ncbi:response regulator transcription factor [Paenibacillus harenae]|uniref:response regulator transcription factor n=1 Tax=Paenibacillus harenae TaxID=306543 RepID=UPI00041D27E4|nr:response regulator [Paenibacillus harenae]